MKKIKASDYFSTQRRIKALRRHIAYNSPPKTFAPTLRLLLKGLSFNGTTLENKFINRSRWNDDGRLFEHVNELKYPPKDAVKKKGRLNDVEESIFYASLCELGSIIESRPPLDQLFTIAKIKKVDGQSLIFFPLAIEKPTFIPIPKNKSQKMIFDYLYGEITKIAKHENEYNSTIAIAHHFLRTKINSDLVQKSAGLAYPSAVGREISNSVTYNLAMLPEVFDTNYRIVEATVYFLSNEETHYQLNPLNVASVGIDGELIWECSYKEMLEKAVIEFRENFKQK